MAFGPGNSTIDLKEDILNRTTEFNILTYYLGIKKIPCLIQSPLRNDSKPSFGLYSKDGITIKYKDFSTNDTGGTFDLLSKLWNKSFKEVLDKVYKDLSNFSVNSNIKTYIKKLNKEKKVLPNNIDLQCKVREWNDYDLEYWKSFGISLEWLKYAEVYPISHKIIIKDNQQYTFIADKYAYAYVEHKEGKVTLKIYQPFNTKGFKWSNKHDTSVISLWTKVPEYGDRICICSSLKDALCLWANTGIPSLAVQGEGYTMSNTAINELKRRFRDIYILFDNDKAGLENGIKFAEITGFNNLVLPTIEELGNPKDVSDLYKSLNNKKRFIEIIKNLFINN